MTSTLRLDRPTTGIVTITLNRPDRLNAMTDQMFRELESMARLECA
jgi:enoyl-CoA hydratase/carnithine racemase